MSDKNQESESPVSEKIEVFGAREHNLKNIDLSSIDVAFNYILLTKNTK
jgi:excinuclease UvrABC ATPase subunit